MGRLIRMLKDMLFYWREILMILTPVLACPLIFAVGTREAKCAYVILVMAVYWIGELVPLAVTALFPVFMYPLLGVLDASATCSQYLKDSNFLFVGGIMVALAVEEVNLHRRFALRTLLLVGSSTVWLMMGFMGITAFLSMWMSNTATTAMMLPIALAVCEQIIQFSKTETHAPANRSVEYGRISISNSEGDIAIMSASVTTSSSSQEPDGKRKNELDFTHPARFNMMSAAEQRLTKALVMSIAYAANIGGLATVTGTAANIVGYGGITNFTDEHPNATVQVSFASWIGFALPSMLLTLIVAWLWMLFYFFGPKQTLTSFFSCCKRKGKGSENSVNNVLRKQYHDLGPFSFGELATLLIFILLVLAWIFRAPQFIKGWVDIPGIFTKGFVTDAVPAMLVSCLLFVVPMELPDFLCCSSRDRDEPPKHRPSILTWKVIKQKFPWNIILLLGGGFAMAEGVEKSGLSALIGKYLTEKLDTVSPVVVCVICMVVVSVVTSIASNAATASIFVPVLLSLSVSLDVHYLYLTLPSVIACSYAFVLPVSTPPNAIVYGSGIFKVTDMIVPGFGLNCLCIGVNMFATHTWMWAMFDFGTVPTWQQQSNPSPIIPSNSTTVTPITM